MSSNIGYVLINKEKKIQGISSSCLKLMGVDVNRVKRMNSAGYDINKLAPDIDYKKEELTSSKNGIILEWVIPFFSRKRWG